MFGLTFLHLLICFAARRATNVCVSSLRFGSGLYDEAGFLEGSHVGVCVWVGILTLYPAGGPYNLCVGFFLWRRCGVSSPPAGGSGGGEALPEPLLV